MENVAGFGSDGRQGRGVAVQSSREFWLQSRCKCSQTGFVLDRL
jgi:hypothetical protein